MATLWTDGRVQFTAKTLVPVVRRTHDQKSPKVKPSTRAAVEVKPPSPVKRRPTPAVTARKRPPAVTTPVPSPRFPKHSTSLARRSVSPPHILKRPKVLPPAPPCPSREKELSPAEESIPAPDDDVTDLGPPPPPLVRKRPPVPAALRDHDYAWFDNSSPSVVSMTADYGLSVPTSSSPSLSVPPDPRSDKPVIHSGELPVIIQDGAATVEGLRRYTRVVERDEYKQKMKPKGLAKFISQSEDDKMKARQALSEMRRRGSLCNNYVCRICFPPQRFTALSSLQSHYKSHLGLREFTCKLCEKSFTRKMSLDYHMLIHADKSRFRCESCGHEFRHKSHYTEHLRRHTGETPYVCSECGLGFKAKNTYRRHLETKHRRRLTHTGNIVILSEDEHQRLVKRSANDERARRNKSTSSGPEPPSPSRLGYSYVDVVVRDSTGQVEYMCNSGVNSRLPPLLRPSPTPSAAQQSQRVSGEVMTTVQSGAGAAGSGQVNGVEVHDVGEVAAVMSCELDGAVPHPQPAPEQTQQVVEAIVVSAGINFQVRTLPTPYSQSASQTGVSASADDSRRAAALSQLKPSPTPPPPPPPSSHPAEPLARVNLTSTLGNYGVFYTSGNLTNTLSV